MTTTTAPVTTAHTEKKRAAWVALMIAGGAALATLAGIALAGGHRATPLLAIMLGSALATLAALALLRRGR